MSVQKVVIQSEELNAEAAAWLAQRVELRICPHEMPDFHASLSNAAGLVVRTYTVVDERLLDAAPHLEVVARAGVGLDNINVAACRSRGVQVVYTPDANTQAVVEYVFMLLLRHCRPLVMLDQPVSASDWKALRADTRGARQLDGLTLGVLGLGRIGRRVSATARSLGMPVIYHDLITIPPEHRHGAQSVSFDDLLGRSDVLTVHVDGRSANRHLLDAQRLGQLRADVLLINTSRGFVVDSGALADFLRRRPQATAMLDVHDPEPIEAGCPLLTLPNAQLFPHMASRTETAMRNMSWVVRDVFAVLEGRPPQFPAPIA